MGVDEEVLDSFDTSHDDSVDYSSMSHHSKKSLDDSVDMGPPSMSIQ